LFDLFLCVLKQDSKQACKNQPTNKKKTKNQPAARLSLTGSVVGVFKGRSTRRKMQNAKRAMAPKMVAELWFARVIAATNYAAIREKHSEWDRV